MKEEKRKEIMKTLPKEHTGSGSGEAMHSETKVQSEKRIKDLLFTETVCTVSKIGIKRSTSSIINIGEPSLRKSENCKIRLEICLMSPILK